MTAITQVSLTRLRWQQTGRAMDASGFYPVASEDGVRTVTGYVLRIATDAGVEGQHTWTTGVNGLAAAQIESIAGWLVGQDPFRREYLWTTLQRAWRKYDRLGIGPIDIALWDIAGKAYGVPVSQLLGGWKDRLPAYASTLHGDESGPLSSPKDYAEFAAECRRLGYRAFKVHGWNDGSLAREIETVHAVRDAVGPDVALMLDPACAYVTFADALTVGRAVDEAGYFWYEDPYQEGGVSAHAHRRLRELLRTPLLMGEHVRGFSAHVDQVVAGGTDFVRADAGLDAGITGAMKLAHAAEGFGLDVELHGPGPAHRHCMSAIRNTNYYELGLVAPSLHSVSDGFPVYADFRDDLESVDADGTVDVPTGPGLGVTLDEEWIAAHEVETFVAE
ncbi:enolase C-terminal domain-like protein [Nocardioides sp. DS6]|uniref:Enolase C-terminal domain-like protein n=1 Tax=Nocardioides eburneus TaxID=3231482 RepID=A0ABV3T1G8_9ACTN